MAGKRIDEHTLKVLEFEEVKTILASFAASDLGRDAARALYPSVDGRWVQARLAETTELTGVLERGERVPMAGLRDIRALLTEFGKKQTVLEPPQLLEVADTLAASGRLRLFLTNLERSSSGGGERHRVAGVPPARGEGVSPSNRGPEALDTRGQDVRDTVKPAPTGAIARRDEPRNPSTNERLPGSPSGCGCAHLIAMGERLGDFQPTVDEIGRCIGGDQRVRDDASPKLQESRRRIGRLSEAIHQRFMSIIAAPGLRKAIENENFLMRHGRPVVAVKAHYRSFVRGTVLDRSNTGATLYIEPDELVELSNDLEDAVFEEKKEVGRILWTLTKMILDQQETILDSVKMLALVDLTYAKARFSVAYGMSPPDLDGGASLHLRQARHPLLLQLVARQKSCPVTQLTDEVVPIDIRLGDDFDLLLVTGPNTGGKTVVLKTIGLLTAMAQSGMHIPARAGSRTPVFRQIFADIGDEQSIQQSLSTFSAHMGQVVKILERAHADTLVLLDELGAGTDPIEGAVLATAILEKLMHQGSKVVATTHLGQLKSFAYTTTRAENASVQFDTETLKPTYRLMIGTPGSSNALVIAQRLGMPKDVIGKAGAMLATESDGTSELLNQIQATREDAERKRVEAQSLLDEAGAARSQAAERLQQVEEEGRRLRGLADREIDDSMQAVRRLTEEFAAEMQNAPGLWNQKARGFAGRVAELAAGTPLAQRHSEFIAALRRGDTVYVVPFRREGIVERIRKSRGTIVVFVDSKQVEIPFREVAKPDGASRS
jgi:DNA mismatch repair protein MutS2